MNVLNLVVIEHALADGHQELGLEQGVLLFPGEPSTAMVAASWGLQNRVGGPSMPVVTHKDVPVLRSGQSLRFCLPAPKLAHFLEISAGCAGVVAHRDGGQSDRWIKCSRTSVAVAANETGHTKKSS